MGGKEYHAWREHFDRMPPLAWQRRFLAATLGCTIDASTSPAPDLSKAAREALCRERHRTLPFRKAANEIASNSTKKVSTFIDSLCGSSSYLVLLVGTLNGDPLPKGDAARYKLIIERKALHLTSDVPSTMTPVVPTEESDKTAFWPR